jgi:hypothetical protein
MSWRWNIANETARRHSGLTVALPACLAGLAAVTYFFRASPFQFPYDDSFITMEFARNLAAIGRVSYDGIHTMPGATSLLHTMMLAATARLGIPLEFANVTLGVLFFVLLIQRTASVAEYLTQSRPAALYAAMMTALTGFLVFDALNGMETTLFMFLAVGCAGALFQSCDQGKGYWRTALWLYLAALARPEGLWLAASMMVYLAARAVRRRQPTRQLAGPAGYLGGALLLLLLTEWWMTGSVTPHTALAKAYFFNELRDPLVARFGRCLMISSMVWKPLTLALFPALWTRKARRLLGLILPWALITLVMFGLLLPYEIAGYQGRYLHPLMPLLFIVAGDGFSVLLHQKGEFRIPHWGTAIFLAALAGILYFELLAMKGAYVNEKVAIENNHLWAVQWLRANAPPGARVATHDIGALRYLGRYEMVDVSGLTDEAAMARNRAERGQLEYLLARRPDYLVGDDRWLANLLHYFPGLGCCATVVATAHPNAIRALRLRIYRFHWDQTNNNQGMSVPQP